MDLYGLKSRFLGWNFFHPPRYPNPQIPRGWICTNSQLIMKQKELKRWVHFPSKISLMAFTGRIRSPLSIQGMLSGPAATIYLQLPPPKNCTKSAKLILQVQVNSHPIVSTKKFLPVSECNFILFCNTGCDSAHVIGMVEPMGRPLVSNG